MKNFYFKRFIFLHDLYFYYIQSQLIISVTIKMNQQLLRPQPNKGQMTVSKCLSADNLSINDDTQIQCQQAIINVMHEGFSGFKSKIQFACFNYPQSNPFYSLGLCDKLMTYFLKLQAKQFQKSFLFIYNYGHVFLQASWELNKLAKNIDKEQIMRSEIQLCSIILQLRGILQLIKAQSILRMILFHQKPSRHIKFTELQRCHIEYVLKNDKKSQNKQIKKELAKQFSQNILHILKDLKKRCKYNEQLCQKQNIKCKLEVQLIKNIQKNICESKNSQQFYDGIHEKKELQTDIDNCVKYNTNKMYKFIFLLLKNENNIKILGKLSYSLLFLLAHIKLYSQNFFTVLLKFYQDHKLEIIKKQRSLSGELFKSYQIRINKVYRSTLPKVTLLFKHSGLMNVLMFIQESDQQQITEAIQWCKNASQNLNKNSNQRN